MEQALFAGLHFDKKRFKNDIQLFKKNSVSSNQKDSLFNIYSLNNEDENENINEDEDENEDENNLNANLIEENEKKNKKSKKKKKSDNVSEDDLESISLLKSKSKSKLKSNLIENEKEDKNDEKEKKRSLVVTQEVSNSIRKKCKIHVKGQSVPPPLESFDELKTKYNCRNYLVGNLKNFGFVHPSPIQRQAIPILLSNRECFACAPTGSGKTIAFLVPILIKLKLPSPDGIRAVILTPTRELALQTSREFKKIREGRRMKCKVMTKAIVNSESLSSSCDILISTPQRLSYLVKEKKIDLSKVLYLVLDEADKLFDMNSIEEIDEVVHACSHVSLVKALFSATLPDKVEELARSAMDDPIRIIIGNKNIASETINQQLVFVGNEQGKLLALRQMIKKGIKPPVLIFVQSKDRAKQLYNELYFEYGLSVDVTHSDRPQEQRDAAVSKFREGKTWMLIATDLMARGMDFKGVNVVINYDFPPSTISYIHRIGRCGRAGQSGEAVTFYTSEDTSVVRSIANVIARSGCEVPPWMLELPQTNKREKRIKHVPKRKPISTQLMFEKRNFKRKRDMTKASKSKSSSEAETRS